MENSKDTFKRELQKEPIDRSGAILWMEIEMALFQNDAILQRCFVTKFYIENFPCRSRKWFGKWHKSKYKLYKLKVKIIFYLWHWLLKKDYIIWVMTTIFLCLTQGNQYKSYNIQTSTLSSSQDMQRKNEDFQLTSYNIQRY